MTPDDPTDTRIRRMDALRDHEALAKLYAGEDSDRGFLARVLLEYLDELPCYCAETSARNCPRHSP